MASTHRRDTSGVWPRRGFEMAGFVHGVASPLPGGHFDVPKSHRVRGSGHETFYRYVSCKLHALDRLFLPGLILPCLFPQTPCCCHTIFRPFPPSPSAGGPTRSPSHSSGRFYFHTPWEKREREREREVTGQGTTHRLSRTDCRRRQHLRNHSRSPQRPQRPRLRGSGRSCCRQSSSWPVQRPHIFGPRRR
jgi:hypothetical protein